MIFGERELRARKAHQCDWCYDAIEVGEQYRSWRWKSGDYIGTVKEHPECYEAQSELVHAQGGGEIEFTPGDNPRGCWCGFDADCKRCFARKSRGEA